MEDGSNMDGRSTGIPDKRPSQPDSRASKISRLDALTSVSQNGDGRKQELAELKLAMKKEEVAELKKQYLEQQDEYMKEVIKKDIATVHEEIDSCLKEIRYAQEGRLEYDFAVLKEERIKLEAQLSMARSNYLAEKGEFMKKEYEEDILRIKDYIAQNNEKIKQNLKAQMVVAKERISIFQEMTDLPFSENDREFCTKLLDTNSFNPSFKAGEDIDGLLNELEAYFSEEVLQADVDKCRNKYFSQSFMDNYVSGCGENVQVCMLHPYIVFLTLALRSFCRHVGFGYDVTDNAILDILPDKKDDKSATVKRAPSGKTGKKKDDNEKGDEKKDDKEKGDKKKDSNKKDDEKKATKEIEVALRPDISILAGPFPIFRAELKASDRDAEKKNAHEALRQKSVFLGPTHDRAPFVFGIVQCGGNGYVCAIYPDSKDENKIVLKAIKQYNIPQGREPLLAIFIQIARVSRWLIQWAPTRLISSLQIYKNDAEDTICHPRATLRSSVRKGNAEEYTTIGENSATKVVASRTDVMKTLYSTLLEKREQSLYPNSLICPKEFKELQTSKKLVNVTFDSLYSQPRFPINTHECVRVIADILAALLYLHKLGYVHRDLRRNNILRKKVLDDHFVLIDFEHADFVGEIFPYDEVDMNKYCLPERIHRAYNNRMNKGEKTPCTDEKWQKLDDIAQFREYIFEAVAEMKTEEDKENGSFLLMYLKQMAQDEYKTLENMSEGENVTAKLEDHVELQLKKMHTEAPTGG